jgi:hypothetical protein
MPDENQNQQIKRTPEIPYLKHFGNRKCQAKETKKRYKGFYTLSLGFSN